MWKRPTWCWWTKLVLLHTYVHQCLKKQPAEFTQYTRFQHFTRCVHQKFCCAFTRMLAVKQGKIDWIDHETFPTRYYLIKRYQLLYLGITMKLTDDRSTMTINHEIQEQFIFFLLMFFQQSFFGKCSGVSQFSE